MIRGYFSSLLVLMDPFSDDISSLSRDKKQQNEYRRKIISTIRDLYEMRKAGYKFDVRLYPTVPPLRLMISDSSVTALSVYSSDTNGWKNAQLIFDTKNCPDSLAPYFLDLFDDLWERGLNFNLSLRAEALNGLLPGSAPPKKTKLGMVHGRFQPFHHEHFEYILHGITHSDHCIIGITQPNINSIAKCEILPHRGEPEGNPFSFEQRADMIRISLENLDVDEEQYTIIPFDVDNIEESVKKLTESHHGEKPTQFIKIFSEWELHKKKKFEALAGC